MNEFLESRSAISLSDGLSAPARIVLGIFGCVPFLAPYELLIRPRWNDPGVAMIIPIIISAGALMVAACFLAGAISGVRRSVKIDAASRVITYEVESSVTSLKRRCYDFEDFSALELVEHDWSDGPTTYCLRFELEDGTRVELGRLTDRATAERLLARIQEMTGVKTSAVSP
ncbi:MAG: hypothetical protein HYV07_01405 [Deltaproteobacteria bacterium]|nr:hypothetical protein [Deltaproteobacteria bacterium]